MKRLYVLLIAVSLTLAGWVMPSFAVSDFQPQLIRPSELKEDEASLAEARLPSLLIRAKYLSSSGENEKAEELYREIIEEFPESAYAHFQLASLLLGADEMDARIEHLEKAIELDPQLKDAYDLLGLSYRIKGDAGKAIATYRKGVENIEENLSFYANLADAYVTLRQPETAEKILLEACERHPGSPDAWFKLVEFYVGNRQWDQADKTIERALKETGNSLTFLRNVWGLYLRWDEEKALAVLNRMLELYPQSPQMWLQLVHYYLTHGQKDNAAQATRKAMGHLRFDEDFLTNLATVYASASDLEGAIAVLAEATKIHSQSVEVWRTLARLYAQKGERQKARECYQQILSLEPARVQERILVARSYVADKEYPRAIEEFQKAIRLHPNDIRIQVDLANAHLAAGDFSKGEQVYLDLIEQRPGNSDIILLLANYYYKAGRTDQMEKTIESAVQSETDPAKQVRMYSLMGQAALEKGDTDVALRLLQEAVKKQPADPLVTYVLARAYLLSGDTQKAAEQLAEAIKKSPSPNPDWLLTLGETYRVLGKTDEANESFRNAIATLQQQCESQPKNWMLRFQLGQAYEKADNDQLAAEAYAESVKLQPDNGDVRYKLATVHSGLRQHENARKQLEEAIKLESPKPEWFLLLGEVYRTLTKQVEAAQAFQRAISLLEEQTTATAIDYRPWAALGEAYTHSHEYDKGVEALRKALELAGDEAGFVLHAALGGALAAAGDIAAADEQYRKAAELLEEAAEETPQDSQVFLRLGLVHQNMREYPKAAEAFSKGIELAGGNASYTSYIALADCLERSGNSEESLAQYQKAYSMLVERVASHPYDVVAYYMLGNVCDRLDKVDECEKNYKTAAEIDPYFAAAYNNLAYTYIVRDMKIPEAMKLVQKALELEPDSGAYVDTLGWGYFKQGKLDEALAELLRAMKLDSSDPTIYDHIGDVYKAKNMLKEAVDYWQKALDMNPNDAEIKAKIEEHR